MATRVSLLFFTERLSDKHDEIYQVRQIYRGTRRRHRPGRVGQAAGNFFLQSGFESQFYGISQMDPQRSMEALREAILRALQEGDLLPDNAMSDELREMLNDPNAMNSEAVKDLLDKLTERLANEGFINPQQPPQVTPPPQTSARGQIGQPQDRTEARFEIADKTIDFLGFKTLQDLLGSLGRSSFGRHDTRDLATGVESGGISRPYE